MSLKEVLEKFNITLQVEENNKLVDAPHDAIFEKGCNDLFEGKDIYEQRIMLEIILNMDLLTFMIENYQRQTKYDESRCIQDMMKLYFEAEGDMQWMERVYPAMMSASKVKPIMKLQGDEIMLAMGEVKCQ